MKRLKNPDADLKRKYKKTLEACLAISLGLHIFLFRAMPNIETAYTRKESVDLEIKVEDIPKTEHLRDMPTPPARPAVPIPTLSEDVPEDVTIGETDLSLDLSTLPPPPQPREEETIEEQYVFIPYDEPPMPIGGFDAILANLKYPELARKAGLEGRVIVAVLVDTEGNSLKTQILKGSALNVGFEEAARAAVMAVKWKPAIQRDHPVKVWVAVPISFKLRQLEEEKQIT